MKPAFAALTHAGRREGPNQDAIGWDEQQRLWLVADGMGGHQNGQVASTLVRQTLLAPDAVHDLGARVLAAHQVVMNAGAANGGKSNMGSTVVCGRFGDFDCEIVWVGDSRAYLWRDGKLSRLTRDHSFAESLRQNEQIGDEYPLTLPLANVLTQTLGMGETVPSRAQVPLRSRDWVLLCSDGLSSELDDPAIAAALAASATPQLAAERLLDAALAHGGRDNISIIIVPHVAPWFMPPGIWLQRVERTTLAWLAVIAGAALAALVAYLIHGAAP